MPSLVILYYILLSLTYFLLNSYTNRLGPVLALATRNGFSGPPDSSLWLWMVLLKSVLQFLPPAPEVLPEIKTTIFVNAFCLLILPLELLLYDIKNKF